MDKKEKYINYVVDDMIKKTEIDYDQEKIKSHSSIPSLPLLVFSPSPLLLLYPLSILFSLSAYSPPLLSFSKYIIERYGIHDNDVDNTWEIYKGKIKEVIDNG
jgi:hypothetical protein